MSLLLLIGTCASLLAAVGCVVLSEHRIPELIFAMMNAALFGFNLRWLLHQFFTDRAHSPSDGAENEGVDPD